MEHGTSSCLQEQTLPDLVASRYCVLRSRHHLVTFHLTKSKVLHKHVIIFSPETVVAAAFFRLRAQVRRAVIFQRCLSVCPHGGGEGWLPPVHVLYSGEGGVGVGASPLGPVRTGSVQVLSEWIPIDAASSSGSCLLKTRYGRYPGKVTRAPHPITPLPTAMSGPAWYGWGAEVGIASNKAVLFPLFTFLNFVVYSKDFVWNSSVKLSKLIGKDVWKQRHFTLMWWNLGNVSLTVSGKITLAKLSTLE